MYCKNCGGEIAEGNDFCPKCGSVVSAPTPTAGNFVNTGGAAVNGQIKFNFAAFFFPTIWCFAKSLWKHAIAQVVGFGILIGCMLYFFNAALDHYSAAAYYFSASADTYDNATAYVEQATGVADGWNNAGVIDRIGDSLAGRGVDYWQEKHDELIAQADDIAKEGEGLSQLGMDSMDRYESAWSTTRILFFSILALHIGCGVYFAIKGNMLLS